MVWGWGDSKRKCRLLKCWKEYKGICLGTHFPTSGPGPGAERGKGVRN